MVVLLTVVLYFCVLYVISLLVGKEGNEAFFRGNGESPWPLVAFGMIGASISGVTFVSVPGMVMNFDMTYLQMCMGFFFGYLVVAFVLLPLYYRQGLTSIYSYLGTRFGPSSRKTGAWFFILSKLTGSAAKLYLVCLIVEQFTGLPFILVSSGMLLLIWLYTRRSGIRTLVWTDALQTLCLITALVLILMEVASQLDLNFGNALRTVWNDPHGKIFEWQDWSSPQHFVKQFVSGIFVVIVMTGLDQDMMQKNLTCKTLRDGQKDLCTYGLMFLPVNFLFLALGVLLMALYTKLVMALPDKGDSLLPHIIDTGFLGTPVLVLFAIGMVASAFSSADSALTALTTSFCIDLLPQERVTERVRKVVHLCMMVAFLLVILAVKAVGSSSVIDTIYRLVSYTYGPLLGLYAFGMTTKWQVHDRWTPFSAVLAPVLCYIVDTTAAAHDYHFGYELLLLNGLLTFIGLVLSRRKTNNS